MTFGHALELVAPLLLPVAVGWLLVKASILKPADAKPITAVFMWVCAPALLIVSLAGEDVSQLLEVGFGSALFLVLGVVYAAVMVFFRHVLRRDRATAAFAALNASAFNSVAIGLPVLLALVGHAAAVPIFIAIVAFLGVLLPITVFFRALDGEADSGSPGLVFGRAVLQTLKNPLIIATIVGIGLAALEVRMPSIATASLNNLGQATIVTALLALGVTLDLGELRRTGFEVVSISVVKVVVSPALAVAATLLFDFSATSATILVVMAGLPTAKTVFVLSEQYDTYTRETAAIVSLTTVSAIVVLPLLVWLSDRLFPGGITG